jgi:hypothetical protein
LNETEIPAGFPVTVADGVPVSNVVPLTWAMSAVDRTPPAPVTSAPEVGLRVRAVTTSGLGGGRTVVLDVLEVEVLDEDELEEVVELDEEEVELDEDELEGSSTSPISAQG